MKLEGQRFGKDKGRMYSPFAQFGYEIPRPALVGPERYFGPIHKGYSFILMTPPLELLTAYSHLVRTHQGA